MEQLTYKDQLVSELARRKMGNPGYSLRAFARSLGVSAAFLSKVINGQKDLSAETALAVADKLGYNAEETAQFCQLVQLSKTADPRLKSALSRGLSRDESSSEYLSLDLESFQVISDWYHYAILELSLCQTGPGERFGADCAARRLGITRAEAVAALGRLTRLGLLKAVRGKWVKGDSFIATPSGRPSRALRNFHAQMIEKAKRAIEMQPVELRDISGITIPVSLDKVEVARKEIQAFRRRMAQLLASSRPTEVYQLNVQFFALTQPRQGGQPRTAPARSVEKGAVK